MESTARPNDDAALPEPALDAEGVSSRDVDAFVRLLGQNQRRIFLYVMSMVPDWNDAEEIIQETNLVLWREFARFQPGTNFTAWACKVALHQVLAWRKRVRRNRLEFSPAFLEAVAREADNTADALEERSQCLARCIERLPEDRRHLLRLRYNDGLAIGAIAGKLERSEEAVYRALSRIRRALHDCVLRAGRMEARYMNSAWNGFEELQPLCEAAIEGCLTADQHRRLKALVLENAEARRLYVEYLHQHASLRWSVAEPEFLAAVPRAFGPGAALRPSPWRASASRRRVRLVAGAVAAAALVALGIGLGLRSTAGRDRPPAPFAALAEVKACKWDGGTLPTEVGARLGLGRLRLAEGLARIVFDHGAEITLEAPADLELLSDQRCILHSGRLVGKVPPPAIGFTVETPTAVVRDLGTEFGVNVHDAGTSDVQVFNGLVDVQHRATGRTEHMRTDRSLRFSTEAVADFDPLAASPGAEDDPEPGPADGRSGRVVHVSTALGRGKDAYIQPKYPSEHHSDILLLVKYSASTNHSYERKAYIGLDLAPVAGMDVVEVRLSLTFAPTGMGYASEVPDATFAVYGLADETLDDWDEETIRWNNAPANLPGGASLDPAKVVRLGTFEIVQGELSGTRSIEGKALAAFLNGDTNGLATFIVVRETQGSGRNDLVHGFANKNHPDLPPPTLRLAVTPRGR